MTSTPSREELERQFPTGQDDSLLPWWNRMAAHYGPDDLFKDGICLYLSRILRVSLDGDPTGSRMQIGTITWTEVPKGTHPPPIEMIHLQREAAEKLMDTLWQAGIRPSDIGTPGHWRRPRGIWRIFGRSSASSWGWSYERLCDLETEKESRTVPRQSM